MLDLLVLFLYLHEFQLTIKICYSLILFQDFLRGPSSLFVYRFIFLVFCFRMQKITMHNSISNQYSVAPNILIIACGAFGVLVIVVVCIIGRSCYLPVVNTLDVVRSSETRPKGEDISNIQQRTRKRSSTRKIRQFRLMHHYQHYTSLKFKSPPMEIKGQNA